jgi:hypothetical protein
MKSKFTYSRLVRPTRTQFFDGAQLGLRKNKFRGYWLDRPIHLYRMWFLLVRLVIDCEENSIDFGPKQEHTVKLNNRFYKGWSMHNYMDARFDDWFADKVHLFGEAEVTLVKAGESSSDYMYLRFGKHQRKEDILRQARLLLKDGQFKSSSRYPIQKQHKYFYLHQQYNTFIMRQNGAKNGEVGHWLTTNYGRYNKRVSTEDAALRKLYRASERLVLDVAKGVF